MEQSTILNSIYYIRFSSFGCLTHSFYRIIEIAQECSELPLKFKTENIRFTFVRNSRLCLVEKCPSVMLKMTLGNSWPRKIDNYYWELATEIFENFQEKPELAYKLINKRFQ